MPCSDGGRGPFSLWFCCVSLLPRKAPSCTSGHFCLSAVDMLTLPSPPSGEEAFPQFPNILSPLPPWQTRCLYPSSLFLAKGRSVLLSLVHPCWGASSGAICHLCSWVHPSFLFLLPSVSCLLSGILHPPMTCLSSPDSIALDWTTFPWHPALFLWTVTDFHTERSQWSLIADSWPIHLLPGLVLMFPLHSCPGSGKLVHGPSMLGNKPRGKLQTQRPRPLPQFRAGAFVSVYTPPPDGPETLQSWRPSH